VLIKCLGGSLGSFFQQLSNALRRLGTLAQPVGSALLIDGQLDFSTRGDRIEETDTLYEATVARIAAVGHGEVVEGALFGAATSETNSYMRTSFL